MEVHDGVHDGVYDQVYDKVTLAFSETETNLDLKLYSRPCPMLV
jgi:hypothetical protein